MNIMVVGEASWNDKNSFGNTISNFFCGDEWKSDHFSCFYARKQLPDNQAQVEYYNLSAIDILKGALRLNIKGTRFSSDEIKQCSDTEPQDNEQKLIDKVHDGKHEAIYYCHELIWRSRIWLNRHFKRFVKDQKPDILFSFCTSPFLLLPVIKYIKNHSDCKVVLFIADDVYGQYEHFSAIRRSYHKRDLKKCISLSDKMYGISSEMCQRYHDLFHKDVRFLTKGCDLSVPPKEGLNDPIRIVYAGNLLWGRDEILSKLADSLEQMNQNGVKAVLEIYTNTTITPELDAKLARGVSAKIMGSRPYQEIVKIMHDADVCLHVESFNEKYMEIVRYSFSTKITDCLQSGNLLLAIGPSGISSIEYCKKIPGAIVVDDLKKINAAITDILGNPIKLNENRHLTREFAVEHHDSKTVQKKLRNSLFDLTERK